MTIIKIIKGTTEVSLLDLSGFHLRDQGWGMNPSEDGLVRELIRCSLIASSQDDAASQFQTLNDLLEDAALYSRGDPVQTLPVYIETQHQNETNKRYALIAGDYVRFRRSPFDKVAQIDSDFEEIDLVITREYPWSSHKPGVLPGRIQLDATDGPAFGYSETDFDVDLVSTFGHKPSTMSGGIIGRPGQFGGGVQVAEATTNLITNPSFETGTVGWTTGGTNTIARSTEQAKYGSYSLKCTYQDNQWAFAVYAVTLTATAHTFGLWAYIPADYNGTDLEIIFSGFTGMTGGGPQNLDMTKRDQWQFVSVVGTPDAGDLSGDLRIRDAGTPPTPGKFIYIDAIQVEAKAYSTPYCDGSLGPGHSWSGAAHGSTSSRAAATLNYDDHAADVVNAQMTILGWHIVESSATFADICNIVGAGSNNMFLRRMSDNKFDLYVNDAYRITNVGSGSVPTLGSKYTFCVTLDFDADDYNLYIHEDSDILYSGSSSASLTLPTVTQFNIGYRTYYANGVIDDFVVLDRVMSQDEFTDYCDSGKAFAGDPNLVFYLPFDGPQQVHIANFRDDVELTHIWNYDDSMASFSANLVASDEWTLFPSPVAIDDCVFFVSTDQPPKHIVLNLRTAGTLGSKTLVLEYYDTSPGWAALTLGIDYTVYPGTTLAEALESTGNVVISIMPPSDFNKADPGTGVAAYHLRIRESHAAPIYTTHPVHAGQLVYTARTNEMRIPSTSLHGDAPPKTLLRLYSDGGGDEDPAFSRISRIIWGIKSRGLDGFTSYLNAGNQDNPAGWAVTYGADSSSSADSPAPGGYSAGITFAGTDTLIVRATFTGANKLEYWIGKYRVFIICKQTGGAAGQTSVRLRTYIGGTNAYDPHVDTSTVPLKGVAVGFEALDMGELNIPFAISHGIDDFSNTDLIFQIFASRVPASGTTLRIWGLILMPIDQASGTINDTVGTVPGSAFALCGNQAVDHDSGVVRRGTNKVAINGINQQSSMSWDSGGAFVEIDQLDVASRIYFLMLHYPAGGTWGVGPLVASTGCHLIGELQLHHSYRLLRGND